MEKPSEHEKEELDVMSIKTVEKLDLSQNADIEACEKCQSLCQTRNYIAGHDVIHCICQECGYEWVQ